MSSLAEIPSCRPQVPQVLRELKRTLDGLGSLVGHLADLAEEREHQPKDDPLLTVGEVAAELRCSLSLVRTACRKGELTAIRSGGWKIRRSAIRTFERRRTKAARR